jgi:hypothetical protein
MTTSIMREAAWGNMTIAPHFLLEQDREDI